MKLKSAIKKVANNLYYMNLVPGTGTTCPICEKTSRKFIPYIRNLKVNARCPKCKSLDRHRLLWLYFKDNPGLFKKKMNILHFAPEPCFENQFSKMKNINYITADLDPEAAMVQMDITNINYTNNYFDGIICNHVLEHVEDDIKAMQESYRILKPGGWAVLMIPVDVNRQETFEDFSIVTPEERLKYFEQEDHVRIYGLDYTDRLKSVGFEVSAINYARMLDDRTIDKYKLKDEIIYLCRK
ncbi:MAG: methyltransferase domain-containing protein [Candidatus Gastranaerophilales bacterium]|nr:methyltransferase domain-containing protein [Candidatus Gastranaerophilales bacterium]